MSFDHVLAAPYGTTILAELGADVIKVESSKGGMDPFRFFGTGEDPNVSPRFLEFNRNKRSFTVNLKHPKGQECCTIWSPRPTPCSTITALTWLSGSDWLMKIFAKSNRISSICGCRVWAPRGRSAISQPWV